MVIYNRKELTIEVDMLKGNINRMCVTDDPDELREMVYYARQRLDAIYTYNMTRVMCKLYDGEEID